MAAGGRSSGAWSFWCCQPDWGPSSSRFRRSRSSPRRFASPLWIGPWVMDAHRDVAVERGHYVPLTLPYLPGAALIDYPPEAVAWWESQLTPLLATGIAGFKLDRGEEKPPDGQLFPSPGAVIPTRRRGGSVRRSSPCSGPRCSTCRSGARTREVTTPARHARSWRDGLRSRHSAR